MIDRVKLTSCLCAVYTYKNKQTPIPKYEKQYNDAIPLPLTTTEKSYVLILS
jgi:hypothetical protein